MELIVFRNVGYQQSNAGETPKRKHITWTEGVKAIGVEDTGG
jgi:hypothetical protein